MNTTTFAERLNERMSELHISKNALAKACGISVTAITYYLTKQRRPNGTILVLIARRLNTSVDYLLGLADDPTPPQTNTTGNMILTNHAFANQLKTCMNANDFNQVNLEEKTGVSQSRISLYLSGTCVPDIDALIIFAKSLNTTTDFLLGNNLEMPVQTKEQAIAMTFSERLKKLLSIRNISRKEFSEKINATEATVSQYANGGKLPSGEALVKIADELDTSADYLLGRTNNRLAPNDVLMANEIYQKLSRLSSSELHVVNMTINQFINTRIEVSRNE